MTAASIKVNIVIDGQNISCDSDRTVLDVATENGIHIPTLCHNPLHGQYRTGACRICLVEVVAGGRPGLEPGCTLPVSPGLSVLTHSEPVYLARRSVVELLLTEHVQDCRNCIRSGDCVFARLCRDYDIDGVSVCAECPNQGPGCLLSRGELCMGPITHAGCDAYCTRSGYRCEGCNTLVQNEDVLRFGLKAYKDAGFGKDEILEGAKVFSFDSVKKLEGVMMEEGFA
jgi:predicted molibdopterin-dependent oxidoreductase YjgC